MNKVKIKNVPMEKLSEVAKKTKSASQACRELGLSPYGGSTTRLRKIMTLNNIDISHWTGQLWSKGLTSIEDSRIKSSVKNPDELFSKNSSANPGYVKATIIKKGLLPYQCAICNMQPIWNKKELKFQMDHINGNRKDHRLKNLRFLCPNCHSQTDTFCGKNKINKKNPEKNEIMKAIESTHTITEAIRQLGINNVNFKKLNNILKEEGLTQKIVERETTKCRYCKKDTESKKKVYCSLDCKNALANDSSNWDHGKVNTYAYRSCRCDLCTNANTLDKRNYKRNKNSNK